MKFISMADLHFSLYQNDNVDQAVGLSKRLSDILKTMTFILDYACNNNIENIVIKGDIIHTKSVIHSTVQNILIDLFNNYNNLNFILLNGNHDMSTQSGTGVSSLRGLERRNVKVIYEPLKIDNILFVPWYKGMVNYIKSNKEDYLISHFGLNEGSLSSGISIVSDIGLKDLQQYKRVLLGHYHKPQEVSNVTYSGSIIQLDWGEKHEEKRFLVVDSEKDEIESIPTKGYRKYYSLDLKNENKDEVLKEAKELKDEGHQVTINKLEEVKDLDIESIGEFRVSDKTERDITNRGITLSMSDEERLNKYLDIQGIDPSEKDEYLRIGKQIIDRTKDQ